MKAQLHHAHPLRCVLPPGYGVDCPYVTPEEAAKARDAYPLAAIRFAYDVLMGLTTEEFSRGGDAPAREALYVAASMLGYTPKQLPSLGWRQ